MELQNLLKIQKTLPKMVPCSGTVRQQQRRLHLYQGNTRPPRVNGNVIGRRSKRLTGPRSAGRMEAHLRRPLVAERATMRATPIVWDLYLLTGRWPSLMTGLPTLLSKEMIFFLIRRFNLTLL